MKKIILTVFIALFAVLASNAEGISGKWKSSFEGPQGSMELNFTFKVDGEKLTGTISSEMGEVEITNGKVNGTEFTYQIDAMGNIMTQKGKLDGEVIKITMEMPEGGQGPEGFEMVLKKVVE